MRDGQPHDFPRGNLVEKLDKTLGIVYNLDMQTSTHPMSAITTVGSFTFDSDTNEVAGPASYMRSDDYRRCVASIENGTNHTFQAAMEHSPSFEIALLVTIQTNYAGWHGMEVFNRQRTA